MRILLLNPPYINKYSRSSRSPAVTKSGTIYFPLWLSYAAGVLDSKGYELKIIDAPAKCVTRESVLDQIAKFNPSLIVIDTSTPSITNDLAFTKDIKEKLPEVKTCLVGTHVSVCVNEILPKHSSYVDFIARHEYDYTLPELAEKMNDLELLKNVTGISYVENGTLHNNPDREFIQDLDELPFVSESYKKYLNIEDYFYAHVSYPTVSIFSSRGCPSKCFYCMYSQVMFGKKYRKRSAKNLLEECVYITKNFKKVKEILIDDDNFAVDQNNVKEFCNLMIENNVNLRWIAQVRVDLEYETMVLMKKAGCILLVAGFESGTQEILDRMKKGITIEQSLQFSNNAHKAGLRVHGCFMVGNPGETKETMMKTLEFSMKLRLDTVQYFPLMVYPGTMAYKWAEDNNYLTTHSYNKWLTPDGMHNCILTTESLTNLDIVKFCNEARRKYYLRTKYILYKGLQCLLSREDFVRTFKSFRIFSKYLLKRN